MRRLISIKKPNFYRLVVLYGSFFIFLINFSLYGLTGERILVLSSPFDFDNKAEIEKFIDSIESDLKSNQSLYLVSADKAKDLITYKQLTIKEDSTLISGEQSLAKAKQFWFDDDYKAALSLVDQSIAKLDVNQSDRELLLDAYITKIIILEKLKQKNSIPALIDKVLSIDPLINYKSLPINRFSKASFKKAQSKFSSVNTASLDIKSNPPAALVYINGIKKGYAPLVINNIPEGSYIVSLKANRYQTQNIPVLLQAGTTQYIQRDLKWIKKKDMPEEYVGIPVLDLNKLQSQIKKVSVIGKELKADKVLWINVQRKDDEEILVARLIDTKLQASFNPVAIPVRDIRFNDEVKLNLFKHTLAKQFKSSILSHPKRYLDPDHGQVQVLRSPKKWYQNPVVLGILGAAVVGGVVTGIVLSDDGDNHSSNDGVVEIGFEGL